MLLFFFQLEMEEDDPIEVFWEQGPHVRGL